MEVGAPPLPPRSRMVDSSTQTDESADQPGSSRASIHQRSNSNGSLLSGRAEAMQHVPEDKVLDTSPERKDTADGATQINGYTTPPRTPPAQDNTPEHFDESQTEESHIEEPVYHSVQTVQPASASQVISKARLVNVPKRVPPKLPPRNPNRSGPLVVDASPKDSSNDQTFADESKHDSAMDMAADKDTSAGPLKDKMEDVKLDDADDEDDEAMRPDPWAKVEETRKREAEQNSTTAS